MTTPVQEKIGGLNRLLLLSLILSSAASYSYIYMFHIVIIPITMIMFLRIFRDISIPKVLSFDFLFFVSFAVWYIISISWSENKVYAIIYCIYIIFGILTVLYVCSIARSSLQLRYSISFVISLVAIEICLSILEGLRVVRLPFSPYSPYREYFGRSPIDMNEFSEGLRDYIEALPTGFMGNPNNLASFLVIMLPFFLFHRVVLIRVFGSVSILTVVYMCGARAALIAYGIVVAVSLLCWGASVRRFMGGVLLVVVVPIGVLAADLIKESPYKRLAEVGATGDAVMQMASLLLEQPSSVPLNSVGVRTALIMNGLQALRDTSGLGVGAGNSRLVQERSGIERLREIGSMHNFWIEILVDGGVLIAALFACWYLYFIRRLWSVGKNADQQILRYCGKSLSVGFIGFTIGAIGPSSVIYMLPMWMLVGFGLSVIRLHGRRRSMIVVRDHLTPLDGQGAGAYA